MSHPLPILTVITPCLNAAKTIDDTLTSVARAAQVCVARGARLEHVVIDGGSTDGTLDKVSLHRADFPFCTLLRDVDGGPYAAMNAGLALATGHYSHILNADDILLDVEDYVEAVHAARTKSMDIILCSIVYFQRPGRQWLHRWMVEPLPACHDVWLGQLKRGLHYPHPGFIARTDLYRAEGFDTRFSLSADYKLMQSLLLGPELEGRVAVSSKPLIGMAEGGASSGWRSVWDGRSQLAEINGQLGISAPAWRRYGAKMWRRLQARLLGGVDVRRLG